MKINKQTMLIAITGGIASGKSEVANIFASYGHKVFWADQEAKRLMETEIAIRHSIIKAFGNEAFIDLKPNYNFISGLVFGDSKESKRNLEILNAIVHPAVIELMINTLEGWMEQGEELVFVESAIIYESELQDGFDYVILVDAAEDKVYERLKERNGFSNAQIQARLYSQMPQELKKNYADFIIENNDSMEKLIKSVENLYQLIIILPPKSD